MSDVAYITNAAATLAFTAGSKTVTVTGTNPILEGVLRGDRAVDPNGVELAIDVVAAGSLTLLRNAPTSGTVQFDVAPVSRLRTSLAANAEVTREVYARQQAAAEDNRSINVISLATAPPGSPADGDRHLVIATATGAFAGKEGYVAQYDAANTRWIFIAPIAGMKVTVDGSAVIRVYTGSAWAIAPPISSATTVDRLARFTDTAGGLGQSQMAEDGSGNVTAVGSVASGSGVGSARMVPGDAARSGYLAFYNAAGVRQGYMGDVAGGLISLYAEAGNAWSISGALTISGAVSALTTVASPGFIAVTGAAGINGYATLKHGDAAATGYLEFQHKDGTRRGYIGYASGGYINAVAEGGYGWNFSGNFLLGGDLALQRSNSGGAVGTDIQNTAAGASAAARLRLLTGTANSLITFQINDNTGSPFALEQSGSAISGIYKYHALHVWGSQAGAERARLDGTFLQLAGGHQYRSIDGAVDLRMFASSAAGYAILGTNSNHDVHVFRNGAAQLLIGSSAITAALPFALKPYTLGTLPSAAAHSGETVRVTDGASNKQIVTSDGSVWRYSDGVSV